MSDYKIIAAINESHKIYLVQHQHTKKYTLRKFLIFTINLFMNICLPTNSPDFPKLNLSLKKTNGLL